MKRICGIKISLNWGMISSKMSVELIRGIITSQIRNIKSQFLLLRLLISSAWVYLSFWGVEATQRLLNPFLLSSQTLRVMFRIENLCSNYISSSIEILQAPFIKSNEHLIASEILPFSLSQTIIFEFQHTFSNLPH